MQLLEERKKKLTKEGLFKPEHKKPLPFLPRTIGVVTSPTGAVIRDILHRVADRFPVRVILWPALVQGDLAAAQIETGIRGFNAMPGEDRPDVLIVGRGGGSIEDLWPFNEENVVRAAFESEIPLISAVGHETDTTLIDYVSDARAPTPTGAAEIAVPVRSELSLQIGDFEQRLKRALARTTLRADERLNSARLPRAEALLDPKRQRFDFASEGLGRALISAANAKRLQLTRVSARLRPEALTADTRRRKQQLRDVSMRARPALTRLQQRKRDRLDAASKLLEALSHQSVIKRGFALVRGVNGSLVRSSEAAASEAHMTLTFEDGDTTVAPIDRPPSAQPKPKSAKSPAMTKKQDQGSLF